jgi:hypothetical protein
MLKGIRLEPDWYTPQAEVAAQASHTGAVPYIATRFLLAPLSMGARERIQNMVQAEGSPLVGSAQVLTVREGLRGWASYSHPETGAAIEFKADKDGRPTDETMAWIPMDVLSELALEIKRRSWMTGETRGN